LVWRIWVASKEVRYRGTTSNRICDAEQLRTTQALMQTLSLNLKSRYFVSRVCWRRDSDQNTVIEDAGLSTHCK